MDNLDGMSLRRLRFDEDQVVKWWPGDDDFGPFERKAMADFVKRMLQPDISIHKPIATLIRHERADTGNKRI